MCVNLFLFLFSLYFASAFVLSFIFDSNQDDNVDVTSEPVEQEVSVGSPLQHTTNKNHQLEVQLGGTVTLQCPQGSLGCWSHLDPINQRLRGLGIGSSMPTGTYSLKDVVYQDAGFYKCVGQSPNNKKKLEVLHTLSLNVKGKTLICFVLFFARCSSSNVLLPFICAHACLRMVCLSYFQSYRIRSASRVHKVFITFTNRDYIAHVHEFITWINVMASIVRVCVSIRLLCCLCCCCCLFLFKCLTAFMAVSLIVCHKVAFHFKSKWDSLSDGVGCMGSQSQWMAIFLSNRNIIKDAFGAFNYVNLLSSLSLSLFIGNIICVVVERRRLAVMCCLIDISHEN